MASKEKASKEKASKLDAADELKAYRNQFLIPENTIYFDGNSLGLLPKATENHLHEVIKKQWGNRLIRSWNDGWYNLANTLGDQLAELFGANAGEIVLSDSTSVNLFKLATAILKKGSRPIIMTDDLNFPTDIYLLQGIADTLPQNYKVELLNSPDGLTMPLEIIEQRLAQENVELLVLSQVVFKSAFVYNMAEVNRIAKQYNTKVIWDLSHSAGAIPINFKKANTEFAVGCTYKYLNGGPGCPAFLYVAKELQTDYQSPIWGWFGDAKPFDFHLNYQPVDSIRQFLVGTPPVLSMSGLTKSLELFHEVGMKKLWEKSKALSSFFITLVEEELSEFGFEVNSPRSVENRGSHVIISHESAYQICQALISEKVGNVVIIPDFRAPHFIRFGFAPFYNSFAEVATCVNELKDIIEMETYKQFEENPTGVT